MRKPKRFYSLKQPKLRQSWNKYNFYNLARKVGDEPPMHGRRTLFQQKWNAKSRSRAYHGEHIAEKKWVRMFSRRFDSAVDMPPKYLAANDGSEQGSGRGSGLSTSNISAESYWQVPPAGKRARPSHPVQRRSAGILGLLQQPLSDITPYMQMTYAPLERRLDTAVFRALFATSVRQARQFVIHGAVTVNGKKMIHPSYQLNPGDMFQVEMEKVLYATGMPKDEGKAANSTQARDQRSKTQTKRDAKFVEQFKAERGKKAGSNKDNPASAGITKAVGETETAAETAASSVTEGTTETTVEGVESSDSTKAPEGTSEVAVEEAESLTEEEQLELKTMQIERVLLFVKSALRTTKNNSLTARKKRKLRNFRDFATSFLGRSGENVDMREMITELESQMKELHLKLGGTHVVEEAENEGNKEGEESEPKINPRVQRAMDKAFESHNLPEHMREKARKLIGYEPLSSDEIRKLVRLVRDEATNPQDETKPYKTPWEPRPFMAAFAFVPRYLEVNPNICAAVYLRHPVARKGMAEVPTPFHYFTNQLTHNWYLGRG